MSEFYAYMWLRTDGTPYYVGKGMGGRAFRNDRYRSVSKPADLSRIVVFTMLNEAEAFESEKALIELFGRKDLGTGCLRNRTDGGDDASGHKHSDEVRKKISEAVRGKTGHPWIKESRGKMSLAMKGNKNGVHKAPSSFIGIRKGVKSEETKQKIRAASREVTTQRYNNPAEREKQSARMTQWWAERKEGVSSQA